MEAVAGLVSNGNLSVKSSPGVGSFEDGDHSIETIDAVDDGM